MKLVDRIRASILRCGPMSFAQFMEYALYDPQGGYYCRPRERFGPEGDFFTAVDLGPWFGRCVARQLEEFDRRLGHPEPFHIVEFGGGRGWLARDVLAGLADGAEELRRRARCTVVERSEVLRERIADLGQSIRTVPSAAALTPAPAGCVLAVELFDALPVHRVRRRQGRLLEVRVTADEEENLAETELPASAPVAAWAGDYGAAPEEGDEAEVCLALDGQIEEMAGVLDRGFHLYVDYGADADQLYSPRHRRGTLLAYHAHATSEHYLDRVGEQDLTAHVNFTALEASARSHGLVPVGRTSQDRFLVANGVLEAFEAPGGQAEWTGPGRVRDRLQARQLIHPYGMGRRFEVLAFRQGVDDASPLVGFRDPFERD